MIIFFFLIIQMSYATNHWSFLPHEIQENIFNIVIIDNIETAITQTKKQSIPQLLTILLDNKIPPSLTVNTLWHIRAKKILQKKHFISNINMSHDTYKSYQNSINKRYIYFIKPYIADLFQNRKIAQLITQGLLTWYTQPGCFAHNLSFFDNNLFLLPIFFNLSSQWNNDIDAYCINNIRNKYRIWQSGEFASQKSIIPVSHILRKFLPFSAYQAYYDMKMEGTNYYENLFELCKEMNPENQNFNFEILKKVYLDFKHQYETIYAHKEKKDQYFYYQYKKPTVKTDFFTLYITQKESYNFEEIIPLDIFYRNPNFRFFFLLMSSAITQLHSIEKKSDEIKDIILWTKILQQIAAKMLCIKINEIEKMNLYPLIEYLLQSQSREDIMHQRCNFIFLYQQAGSFFKNLPENTHYLKILERLSQLKEKIEVYRKFGLTLSKNSYSVITQWLISTSDDQNKINALTQKIFIKK